jgi:hypothetical protein
LNGASIAAACSWLQCTVLAAADRPLLVSGPGTDQRRCGSDKPHV